MTSLWLRHEVRTTEQRAPITPADAARLIEAGLQLSVEQSAHRCFRIEEYAEAGCQIVPAGSWVDAPAEAYVIGLKELPVTPAELRHRHIYFGHAYKDQPGSEQLLRRFVAGGGALLDIEYLVQDSGRRLAAFGYWAGYLGAALTVLHSRGELAEPLTAGTREALDDRLRAGRDGPQPSALVIGALGRSGRGACDALELAGIAATGWDVAETGALDRPALLAHDLLINTVLVNRAVPPFVTPADVVEPTRRLRLICDVTCDVGSPFNVLPIYDQLGAAGGAAARRGAQAGADRHRQPARARPGPGKPGVLCGTEPAADGAGQPGRAVAALRAGLRPGLPIPRPTRPGRRGLSGRLARINGQIAACRPGTWWRQRG